MSDKAHAISDEILKDTQKQLSKDYNEAYKAAKTILAYELSKIDLATDNPQERFNLIQKRLEVIVEKVVEVLADANKKAKRNVNTLAIQVYKENYNYIADTLHYKEINGTESKAAYEEVDFFNALALENLTDKDVLRRELKSKMTTAVLQGKGTNIVYKALKTETETLLKDCVRISTTTTTMCESKGRYDIALKAEQNGHLLKKVWRAIGDHRTRPAHRQASGQVRLLNEPFDVGGEKMMYPGDYSLGASIGNTINCRCMMAVIEY